MIGAVVIALLGKRLGIDPAPLRRGRLAQIVFKLRLAGADNGDLAGRAIVVDAVDVEPRHRLVEGIDRVLGIIGGAEQALLFGCDRQKDDRAFGLRALGEGLGKAEQRRDARGIIERTVVNPVALDGRVRAQVIPVRHVEEVLAPTLGAVEPGNDIVRDCLVDGVIDRDAGLEPQGNGREVLVQSRRLELSERLAGARQHLLRRVLGQPAFDRHAAGVLVGADQIELRPRPGIGHRLPAVSGRAFLVNDQGGSGALARRFLVFVGPAAVIGHRLAGEQGRIPGLIAGIVDQDDHRLAAHVEPLVVVPAVFRRDNAVADKDHVALRDLLVFADPLGPHHHVLGIIENQRLGIAARNGELRVRVGGDRDQRDGLRPLAVVARRQPEFGELFGQMGNRLGFAFRCRAAAAEFVRRQHLNVRRQVVFVDQVDWRAVQ